MSQIQTSGADDVHCGRKEGWKWVRSSRVEEAGLEFMEDLNCSVAHVAFG